MIEVILKQNVSKLGRRGTVVRVEPGYARNYLLPRKMAVLSTPGALKQLELVSDKIDLEEAQHRNEFETVAVKLAEAEVIIEVSTNEEGHLYGSVGPKEVADALQEKGFHVGPAAIEMERHIKLVGSYKMKVNLYHEVAGEVTVYVVGPDGMGMPQPEQDVTEEVPGAEGQGDAAEETGQATEAAPEAPSETAED